MTQISNSSTDYSKFTIKELVNHFKTDLNNGLSTIEVDKRLLKYRYNELPILRKPIWKIYLSPIFNFLILILIITTIIVIILGSFSSTIITLIVIIMNSAAALIQQFRAQKALESLRKITALKASVIRNGTQKDIFATDLVPGDIVLIKIGKKIPADGRIVESINLSINESPLTGESIPVEKSSKIFIEKESSDQHRTNMVYMGTYVDTGKAKFVVTSTGINTEIGKISHFLTEMEFNEDIPLTKKLNKLGHILGIIVIINLIMLIIYKLAILYLEGNFIQILINKAIVDSIIRAMNILPVNLPFLTTLVIISGVIKMAQSGVIIKNLASIESLGRVSIVCSDKTGTITKNEMNVEFFWINSLEYEIEGSKHDDLEYITQGDKIVDLSEDITFQKFIASMVVNNNAEIDIQNVKTYNKEYRNFYVRKINGSPTEAALLILAEQIGYGIEDITNRFKIIQQFPFSTELKRMTTVCKTNDSENMILAFIKGAPQIILNNSTQIEKNNKIERLSENLRQKISDKILDRAKQGFRILSIAYKNLDSEEINKRESIEKKLVFLGFVSIMDPSRFGVKQAVKECEYAGIKVIMITGDHPVTATTIASEVGIFKESRGDIAVEDLHIRDFKEDKFSRISVFSRAKPSSKDKIIEQYQESDKIVAMTGDGINDALALKKAEVGIAMGINGADIAKEAADMIISDDEFTSIVKGIKLGRGIFANIRIIIYFFICLNLMEGIIYFSYEFISTFNLFASNWQHVYIFLLIHGLLSLALIIDKPPRDIMRKPPRDKEEILSKNIWIILILHSFLMGLGIILAIQLTLGGIIPLNAYNLNPSLSYIPSYLTTNSQKIAMKARTMFTTTLFIIETNFIWSIRRLNKPINKSIKEEFNFTLFIICIFTLSIHVLLVFFSSSVNEIINEFIGLNLELNFIFLSPDDWIICILLSLPSLIGIEGLKLIARRKNVTF